MRLTTDQLNHVTEVFREAGLASEFSWWRTTYMQATSPRRVDVLLPPDGWALAQRRLTDQCFSLFGGWNDEVSTAAHRALRSITRELNKRRTHPALHHQHAYGVAKETITAWEHGDELLAIANESPVEARFVVLVPHPTVRGSQPLTYWEPVPPGIVLPEHPMFEESAHLCFCVDRPAAGGPQGGAA